MADLRCADCREALTAMDSQSVNCIVTSPPYFGLRDYGCDGQIGLEQTLDEYIAELVAIFNEARRVLRDDGTLWLNMGDSYAGSGKGGNPNAGKQSTNRGSQGIGVLYGKVGETQRNAAATNVTRNSKSAGVKPKDLIGVPWRLAFALQADGWYLRSDIIWSKPNTMPESTKDRPTKAHEYVFLLSKSPRYYYDHAAIAEPAVTTGDRQKVPDGWDTDKSAHGTIHRNGRSAGKWVDKNPDKQRGHGRRHEGFNGRWAEEIIANGPPDMRNARSVWYIATRAFSAAHFATFPPELAERCIKAGCPPGGTVLDPFSGAGTTALVADRLQRHAIGIEINPDYHEIACRRLSDDRGSLFDQPATDTQLTNEALP